MTIDLHSLRAERPEVFKGCIGIDMPAGWEAIAVRCVEAMIEAVDPELRSQFRIIQIKEKFGHLTIYHNGDREIDALIDAADEECRRTCQLCGELGKPVAIAGWYGVLCDEDERKEHGQ